MSRRIVAAVAPERELPVPAPDISVDIDLIPLLGVTDVVDSEAVVAGPEERDGRVPFPASEHIYLPLSLSDHPMLDTNSLAGVRVGTSTPRARSEAATSSP